jgi:hypothetical protein
VERIGPRDRDEVGAVVTDPGGPRVGGCFRSARDVRLTGWDQMPVEVTVWYVGCGGAGLLGQGAWNAAQRR